MKSTTRKKKEPFQDKEAIVRFKIMKNINKATLERLRDALDDGKKPSQQEESLLRGFEIIDNLMVSAAKITEPITGGIETEGSLFQSLLEIQFEDLLNPFREDYIHFLHRLVLMGICAPRVCGKYRTTSVHVGNPNLFFAPPSAVPGLMKNFCEQFPAIIPSIVQYDPVKKAAEVSHHFVRIHPFRDGNGRISRLLMNLILWRHYPPVYLKADAKGRHRYAQALRRADNGNIEPLACLIAMSLIEIFKKLLDSLESKSCG